MQRRCFPALPRRTRPPAHFRWLSFAVIGRLGAAGAGPLGGTDMRSALLPPPGLYGGIIELVSRIPIPRRRRPPAPGLDAVDHGAKLAAPFLVYVPDFKLFDGLVGLTGGFLAGRVMWAIGLRHPARCNPGLGDPYFELASSRRSGRCDGRATPARFRSWKGSQSPSALARSSRSDNTMRRPRRKRRNRRQQYLQPRPTFAATHTTTPLLFEGTKFGAKLFWNNFFTNPETQYKAGTLLDIDFALTEHIGRFQVGAAGFYAFQVADDRPFGVHCADGRRINFLNSRRHHQLRPGRDQRGDPHQGADDDRGPRRHRPTIDQVTLAEKLY